MFKRPAAPLLLFAATLLFASADALAQAGTVIQNGHSGGWYDLSEPGHGIFAEVIDDSTSPTGKRIVLAWFAFFNDQQVWIIATGPVVQTAQGQVAVMQAWIYQGNEFPPRYQPGLTSEIPWGEIRLYFLGCDFATVEWDSVIDGFESGELSLQRLTTISGTECDPDLGIVELDDHGNTWQTGTSILVELNVTRQFESRLEHRHDIDVFVFVLPATLTVSISTLGSSDTTGRLHRLTSHEQELAFDDDGGIARNFLIKTALPPGTYTVHVGGTLKGAYGNYTLFFRATAN